MEQGPQQRIQVYCDDSMKQTDGVEVYSSNHHSQSAALGGSDNSLSLDSESKPTDTKALTAALIAVLTLLLAAADKAAKAANTGARITTAPGTNLLSISEFLFSPKTLRSVVNPIIADMQAEYFEALAASRRYKAIWVCARGYWSLVKAVGLYSLLRTVAEVWRKVSM